MPREIPFKSSAAAGPEAVAVPGGWHGVASAGVACARHRDALLVPAMRGSVCREPQHAAPEQTRSGADRLRRSSTLRGRSSRSRGDPVRYTQGVSEEPLEIIRVNECEDGRVTLTRSRVRRLWNEIEFLRDHISGAADHSPHAPRMHRDDLLAIMAACVFKYGHSMADRHARLKAIELLEEMQRTEAESCDRGCVDPCPTCGSVFKWERHRPGNSKACSDAWHGPAPTFTAPLADVKSHCPTCASPDPLWWNQRTNDITRCPDTWHPWNNPWNNAPPKRAEKCPQCGSPRREFRNAACENPWHDFGDGETVERELARAAMVIANTRNFSIDLFDVKFQEILCERMKKERKEAAHGKRATEGGGK